MTDFDLIDEFFIDGAGLSVTNPANGAPLATVKAYSADEAEAAIVCAADAGKAWAARTAKDRAKILRRWYELMLAHQDKLARIATLECGKPLAESKGEVLYAAAFLEWYGEEGKRAYGTVIPTHAPGKRIVVLKQPVGVVAAITPWNFPLAMITRKAGPALAAGCPFLIKPAEATPLSCLAMEKLALEAGVPPGVFKTITTTDPAMIGRVFCASSSVRKLSFTGSTAVGKTLMAQGAETVKKISLELGGNAPMIIFDDADLEAAVDGTMASKYRNAGQTCVCANRILVQAGVHDRFVDRLTARVQDLTLGDGLEEGVTIGPLINEAGLAKVTDLVDQAVGDGAKALTGGVREARASGAYYQPTVLTGIRSGMAITQKEIFGPVAPVIKFETDEEAIAIANDTPYGLAAYFYAQSHARIWKVMEALEYGMVGVNEGILSTEVAPFGGIKESGLGREGAAEGLDEYLESKYCLLGGLA